MRLLFVSNLYPPHARGGYERWCREVARALAARGHQLLVITSRAPGRAPAREEDGPNVVVERVLELEVEGGLASTLRRLVIGRELRERAALERLDAAVTGFRPDATLLWGMWNLPREVPASLEARLGCCVGYYIADYWPTLPPAYVQQLENRADHFLGAVPKRLVRRVLLPRLRREHRPSLELSRSICTSRAVRDRLETLLGPDASVVYGGVDVQPYLSAARNRRPVDQDGPLRLLYAGRLDEEKGVHTIIAALAMLVPAESSRLTLELVGDGPATYVRQLRQRVAEAGLGERVTFVGPVPDREMPARYSQHDVLIFPSEWPEPFGRTLVEGMATGLLAVGTATGGAGEILTPDTTGLAFPPGDAAALASRLRLVLERPELTARLARAGQRHVAARFTLERMVRQLEETLQSWAQVPA